MSTTDQGAATPASRAVRVQRRPRRNRRRRVIVIAVLVTVVLFLLGWVGVRALGARQHLNDARSALAQARTELVAGHVDQANARLLVAEKDTRAARRLTSDPLWRFVSWTPYAGRS